LLSINFLDICEPRKPAAPVNKIFIDESSHTSEYVT
jgi:hypothetical protein